MQIIYNNVKFKLQKKKELYFASKYIYWLYFNIRFQLFSTIIYNTTQEDIIK